MIRGIKETEEFNTSNLFIMVVGEAVPHEHHVRGVIALICPMENLFKIVEEEKIAFGVSALKWKRMCEEAWRFSRLGIKIYDDEASCGYCIFFRGCRCCPIAILGQKCKNRCSTWQKCYKEKDFSKRMLLTIEMYRVVLLSQSYL